MAINTSLTYLKHGDESLIACKTIGALGSETPTLDVTTLEDTRHKYINDIEDLQNISFTANYTKEDMAKLTALFGKTETYTVEFSDGGKATITGQLSAYVNELSVGAAVEISGSIAVEDIALSWK